MVSQSETHFNEALQLETEAAMRAARVIAKARREALEVGKATKDTKVFLEAINATLRGMDKELIKELRAEGILEKGYRQGRAQVKGMREGGFTGFEPLIDPYTLSQEASKAVDTMKGVEQYAKGLIKETIEIGLARGEGAGDLMRRLVDPAKGAFKMTQRKAEMRARTISNDLVNAGKQASYRDFRDKFPDLGLNNQWYNISDSRSSEVCKGLNGEVRSIGAPFSSGHLRPPAHPFCRSTLLPTLEKPQGSLGQPKEIPQAPRTPKEPPKPRETPKVPQKSKETPKDPEGSLKEANYDFKVLWDKTKPEVDIEYIFYNGETLGAGAFGRVYAKNGIAIKLGAIREKEVEIHRELGERGIAAKVLSGLSQFEGEPVYAMEELKGFQPVRGGAGIYVLNQAAIAMHKAGYVHNDLHGGNVLMNPQTGEFRVIDFGLSEKTSDPVRMAQEYLQASPLKVSKEHRKILKLMSEGHTLDTQDDAKGAKAKWAEAGERYRDYLETLPNTLIVPEGIRKDAIYVSEAVSDKKKPNLFAPNVPSDPEGIFDFDFGDLEDYPKALGGFSDLFGSEDDLFFIEGSNAPLRGPEVAGVKSRETPKAPKDQTTPRLPRDPNVPVNLKEIVEAGRNIGGGAFGKVYALDGVAVKVGAIARDETRIQGILADAGLAPKVLSEVGEVNGEKAYAMEQIDPGFKQAGNLENAQLAPVMVGMLMKIHETGVVHNDFHSGNVMFNPDTRESLVIDFGMSSSDAPPSRLYQEFSQIARSLDQWHSAKPDMFLEEVASVYKKALKVQELFKKGDPDKAKALEAEAVIEYYKLIDPEKNLENAPKGDRADPKFGFADFPEDF